MSSENEDKKPTIPTKSSMEILSELFSTFHAEPPLIIKKEKSEESNKKHKKSKKKHKHKDKKHKKKEKKRKKSSSSSSDDSEVDLARILIKQEKDASNKIKRGGTDLEWNVRLKNLKKEEESEDESEDSSKVEISNSSRHSKIAIKGLKLDSIFESTIKEIHDKVKREVDEEGEISDSESSDSDKEYTRNRGYKNHTSDIKKRSRSSSKDKSDKKLKIDDLRSKVKSDHKHREKSHERSAIKEKDRYKDYNNEKDFYKGSYHSRRGDDHRIRDRDRDRMRDRQKDHRSRSRERHKDSYNREVENYKRNRNSFYKDDGFYKPREKEDRDEKSFVRDRYVNTF